MIVLFFISALSIHSFFVHNNPFYVFLEQERIERVDSSLDQQNNRDKKNIKVKTIASQKNEDNAELDDGIVSDISEDLVENNDLEGNSEIGDEYEEIIFEDNFDKEYWEGTEDNYLE